MTPSNEPSSFMTAQQQAHIDHMTEQFRRFAEAIEQAETGVARFTGAVKTMQSEFKVKPAA